MDKTTTIKKLLDEALKIRDERNWKQYHDPKNLAAALSIEAGELQELFLWKSEKEVKALLSEAYREAQIIRGVGDAESIRIYGEAYNQNPRFYKLLRTLEAYRKFLDDKTTLVLSSDSEILKLLTEGEKAIFSDSVRGPR